MAPTPDPTATLRAPDAPADSIEGRIQTAELFAEALKQDQFWLFGQPIAPLAAAKSGHRYLEIFVRFREEEEHLLPPGTFFPILEANHLTAELDRWVVRKVLGWASEKRDSKTDWQIPCFNINLADDTINDKDFARHVLDALYESRIPPDRLWFELTVKQLARFRDAARQTVSGLQALGCALAVSDFAGTEADARDYWNAGVRVAKLAGNLVRDVHRNPRALSSLLSINDVCHKVGLQTIAQFVEARETLPMLRKAGVDFAQGFCIAVPVPLSVLN
jgi:EAL domain-containing protein (putative c-di-GMP-specific phosphodiesterase class I)